MKTEKPKSIPLKEIVGFLPYKLKGKALHLPEEPTVELSGLGQRLGYTFDFWLPHKHGKTGMIAGLGNFMPLVRPLSDLTKEITHNGETFVPEEFLNNNSKDFYLPDDWNAVLFIENENILSVNYSVIQKLYEWHFDIYDWIKDGLAVDINTLNKDA